jgi:hypothetical protein
MSLSTLCFACKSPIETQPGSITFCRCSATFIAIEGFPTLSGHQDCYRLNDALFGISSRSA